MQGKGPDGRAQPTKETRAGHVGLDNTVTVKIRAEASLTEEPDAGKPQLRRYAPIPPNQKLTRYGVKYNLLNPDASFSFFNCITKTVLLN